MATSGPYAGRSHTSTGFVRGINEGLRVELEVEGLDEAIERIQKYTKFGDTDAKRVRAGMSQTVKVVRGEAEKTVPFRTGILKGTLFGKVKTYPEGNASGFTGSQGGNPVIAYVLEGGRRANNRGRMVITPRRWLWHAYSQKKEQVDTIWKHVLQQITSDLAGKG